MRVNRCKRCGKDFEQSDGGRLKTVCPACKKQRINKAEKDWHTRHDVTRIPIFKADREYLHSIGSGGIHKTLHMVLDLYRKGIEIS